MSSNTTAGQPVHTPIQTALDGFDPVPVGNDQSSEKAKTSDARKRFFEVVSGEDGMDTIHRFMKSFGIIALLTACGIFKVSCIGISASAMFAFLLAQVFCPFSIYRREKMHTLPEGVSTSSVSRFLNNPKYRWETFLSKLSARAVQFILKTHSANEKKVFTGDDTDIDRVIRHKEGSYRPVKDKKGKHSRKHKGHRTELVARKYDHARHVKSSGYRMLTLGFADHLSYIPLGFVLLSSQNDDIIVGDPAQEFKKNSAAYQRRMLARGSTMEALHTITLRALKYIKGVKHICVDRWFSNPSQIYELMEKTGLQVITVLKHNKTKYLFKGEEMTITQIYRVVRKHYPPEGNYFTTMITVPGKNGKKDQSFEAKVVFIKNRADRKQWIAILSTDTSLSPEDIIEYYSLRWKTETYFWTAKMFLGLNDECHALSYDAITAHCTIVATRYIMLAIEKRKATDNRTMGDLFAFLQQEQYSFDIGNALNIFANAMFDAMNETIVLTEEQKKCFVNALLDNLPPDLLKYMSYANYASTNEDEPPRKETRKKAEKKTGKKAEKKAGKKVEEPEENAEKKTGKKASKKAA